MERKLTKPQRDLLAEVCEREEMSVSPDYKPTQTLYAAGLITMEQGRYGSTIIRPTTAGRAALSTQGKDAG